MLYNTKELQNKIIENVKEQLYTLDIQPIVKIFQMSSDQDGVRYINQIVRNANYVGCEVYVVNLSEYKYEDQIIEKIKEEQKTADAVILQMPIPKEFDKRKILDTLDPSKDVDCLTTYNIGRMYSGNSYIFPCTPKGVIYIVKELYKKTEGLNVLVVGRSNVVGRPLAEMFVELNCTVTLAHTKTELLKEMLLSYDYDIIVSCVGKPKIFKANAPTLIDVGMNIDENGKLCGDFDLDNSKYEIATPVPNGVGRMTIAAILENILTISKTVRKI